MILFQFSSVSWKNEAHILRCIICFMQCATRYSKNNVSIENEQIHI